MPGRSLPFGPSRDTRRGGGVFSGCGPVLDFVKARIMNHKPGFFSVCWGYPVGGGRSVFFQPARVRLRLTRGPFCNVLIACSPLVGGGITCSQLPGFPPAWRPTSPKMGGGGLSGRAVWTKAVDPDRKRSTPLRIVGALVGRLCLIVLSRPPRGGVGAAPIGPRGHISEPRSFGEAVH